MADSGAPVVAAVTPNPLSRKLNKILESDLDNDKETLEALEVLSECLDKNTLQARRNLRSDLEKRSLSLNKDFLHCVEELVDQVKGLQEEVVEMKTCCDDMQRRLSAAKSRTSGLLRETTQLQGKSKLLDMKSKVVLKFLQKFQLTPQQLQILAGPPEGFGHVGRTSHRQIDGDFFRVMNRVKEIHEDCKVLLHMSKQRAGLEIMESMAMHLESAYEQLYHWVQNQCRLMTNDMPDLSANLRQGLKELHNRPILFQYCIDEYSIARRMCLVQSFIDALTREGTSGRPIELRSHDPVRYCSDMLGWLHQAIATENDHIAGLLVDQDTEKSVSILSMITEGSCRPLHVRVEQVVISTPSAAVAYQLVNLLRYYLGVFQNHLTPTSPLVKTVSDLTDLQSKMFFSTLNSQTAKILGEVDSPLPDLSPTPKASELLGLLQSLLSSRDITVFTSDNQSQDLKLILSSCIDPLIQHCSESVSSMSRLDRAIYLINSLYFVQSTVTLYEFTDSQVESLDMQIQSHMQVVVSEQFGYLLSCTGMSSFHAAMLHGKLTKESFKSIEGCSDRLKSLITAPDQFLLTQSKLLSSGRLREEVLKKAVNRFCEVYEAIYSAVVEERGAEGVLLVMPYSSEQTKQLLLN